MGDINGDGDDIVAFSQNSGMACIHMANGSSYDPVQNYTVNSGLIGAEIGDIDSDGVAEIISISSGGLLSHQSWDNSTGLIYDANQTIEMNGSAGMPAGLASLYVGDFFATGNISA